MVAKYVSIFDNSIRCESECQFNPKTKTVSKIEIADNCSDAEDADSLTDEFVVVNGKELREKDGVTFNY